MNFIFFKFAIFTNFKIASNLKVYLPPCDSLRLLATIIQIQKSKMISVNNNNVIYFLLVKLIKFLFSIILYIATSYGG